jgi:hypothetical protein
MRLAESPRQVSSLSYVSQVPEAERESSAYLLTSSSRLGLPACPMQVRCW